MRLFFSQKLLTIMQYIILGLFQGVTEPLPISSSGHTILLKEMFHITTPGLSFEVILHFGSLLAIIFIYRHDLITIIHRSYLFVMKKDETCRNSFFYLMHLLIATTITGVIGIFLEDSINSQLATSFTVAIALLITGLFLWHIRYFQGIKGDDQITIKDAIIIGCAQALALIPGISRSGATLVAALLIGFKREAALRFSFLLFIPVSVGINILSIPHMLTNTTIQPLFIPYVIAMLSAIIATYFALKWFQKMVIHGKLAVFSVYCFIVGSIVFIWKF